MTAARHAAVDPKYVEPPKVWSAEEHTEGQLQVTALSLPLHRPFTVLIAAFHRGTAAMQEWLVEGWCARPPHPVLEPKR